MATIALALAAGCDHGSTPTSTPPAGSATARGGTGSPAVPTSSAPAGFCADWFRLAAESARFGTAQNATPAQPEALRASVEATTSYLRALTDRAPTEIKADFATYAEWWTGFSAQMVRVDYDFSKVATDPELQRQMQATTEPKFSQASTRIAVWVQRNCNVLR